MENGFAQIQIKKECQICFLPKSTLKAFTNIAIVPLHTVYTVKKITDIANSIQRKPAMMESTSEIKTSLILKIKTATSSTISIFKIAIELKVYPKTIKTDEL